VRSLEGDPERSLVRAFGHTELDIADPEAVARLFDRAEPPPDVLINAAAFPAVDLCESEEKEAFRVNGEGPGLLAEQCRAAGVGLVHVSTDYVLTGDARTPQAEGAPMAPRTAYGRSKAEGERRVIEALPEALVVRTAWVFGPGKNFVGAILRQAALRLSGEVEGPLRVVSDQRGCPTYAADLGEGILALCDLAFRRHSGVGEGGDEAPRGIFHLTGGGEATWWEFARRILDTTGHADLEIEKLSTDQLDLPAERPLYSVLDCGRAEALGIRLRSWQEGLAAYLESPDGAALLEGA
jgi:dTDP-4-dehydrorhamnose reductase